MLREVLEAVMWLLAPFATAAAMWLVACGVLLLA